VTLAPPTPTPVTLTPVTPTRTGGPVVRTKLGVVSGTAGKLPGVSAYLGIPFAAPPVGDLRWRAPQPAAAWKGTRAADHFSPSCIQGPNTPFGPWTS
jgi:para-nitrobenzyl esterase